MPSKRRPHLIVAPDSSHSDAHPSYRWHLTAANGEVILQGEAHTRPADAERAIRRAFALFADALAAGVERADVVLSRTPPEVTEADVTAEGTVLPARPPHRDPDEWEAELLELEDAGLGEGAFVPPPAPLDLSDPETAAAAGRQPGMATVPPPIDPGPPPEVLDR